MRWWDDEKAFKKRKNKYGNCRGGIHCPKVLFRLKFEVNVNFDFKDFEK